MTTIWESRVYKSRYSKILEGALHVEGDSRQDAIETLKALSEIKYGAAGKHARDALEGAKRHTLIRMRPWQKTAYAAKDRKWRGWGADAWTQDPPAAYGDW